MHAPEISSQCTGRMFVASGTHDGSGNLIPALPPSCGATILPAHGKPYALSAHKQVLGRNAGGEKQQITIRFQTELNLNDCTTSGRAEHFYHLSSQPLMNSNVRHKQPAEEGLVPGWGGDCSTCVTVCLRALGMKACILQGLGRHGISDACIPER